MGSITVGEIITIATVIVGLVIQYGAIIVKFSERITRLEVKQDDLEKNLKERHTDFARVVNKDIDSLFNAIRAHEIKEK